MGGAIGNDAYLRFWDGRVLIPWRGATFPNSPGPGAVDLIGAGGHLSDDPVNPRARHARRQRLSNGATAPVRGGVALRDINRHGDVVGTYRPDNLVPQLDTAFLYADGRFTNLSTAVVDGPAEIRDTTALNDDRHIVATAIVAVSGDPSCWSPMPRHRPRHSPSSSAGPWSY